MLNRYARQLDIIDSTKVAIPIHIVGAGGIGSFTTLAIAKMGFNNITVYDFDTVENHNIASQFYKKEDLDRPKVDCLKENVAQFTDIDIKTYNGKIEEVTIQDGILIIAVDSMQVRAEIAEKYKDSNLYIIDGRMGGLQLEIYSMLATDYPETIVPVDDVQHDLCTAKAISFNCMVIGGLIGNYVRKYINNEETKESVIYLFETNSFFKDTYGIH